MSEHTASSLRINIDGDTYTLTGLDRLTFGRDGSCTVCLDATDRGVSRIAGSIAAKDGIWWVTNLSKKRALHITDSNGFAVPLPVDCTGWPPSRRAVDQHLLTVLVPGERWTYALALQTEAPVPECVTTLVPEDPHSTRFPDVRLTDNRREVLAILARGYLRPAPHYDPRPAGYDEVARVLGLSSSQVTRRIEDVRKQLIGEGVENLSGERDNRRALCEWLVAGRKLTPADLHWAEQRIKPGAPQPKTTQVYAPLPRNRIMHQSQKAAGALAPILENHLRAIYGNQWLQRVNANRRASRLPARRSLDDDRFCLAVFAHEPATQKWAEETVRDAAISLKSLADKAAHNSPLTDLKVQEARKHASQITQWAQQRRNGTGDPND